MNTNTCTASRAIIPISYSTASAGGRPRSDSAAETTTCNLCHGACRQNQTKYHTLDVDLTSRYFPPALSSSFLLFLSRLLLAMSASREGESSKCCIGETANRATAQGQGGRSSADELLTFHESSLLHWLHAAAVVARGSTNMSTVLMSWSRSFVLVGGICLLLWAFGQCNKGKM